jgi:hypothetical protein
MFFVVRLTEIGTGIVRGTVERVRTGEKTPGAPRALAPRRRVRYRCRASGSELSGGSPQGRWCGVAGAATRAVSGAGACFGQEEEPWCDRFVRWCAGLSAR